MDNNSSKRARFGHEKAIVDVWQREVGQLSSRSFAHRLAASQDLILKLDILRKLEKHRGCVNTVGFNAVGDILISGSDDKKVVLWDWETGQVKHAFHSGHHANVFQAKFMPYSGDSSIVTCAADGQVRHAVIRNSGGVETSLLGSHDGRAHKMAIEPGSPHIFYTCGEDGLVQHFDLRSKASTELLTCLPVDSRRRHNPSIRLNAITIDPRNPNLFAVGGTDEYARLYDIRMYWDQWDGSNFDRPVNFFCPRHLIGVELVGITGLAFSDSSELLVSYNNENIYLFDKDMGLGPHPLPSSPSQSDSSKQDSETENSTDSSQINMDTDEKSGPQVYKGHRNWDTVKGVSFYGPNCEYAVSGSDCGRIFIWRKKGGELIRVMEADKHVVNCIEPHPHIPMLASSGIEHDIKIWTPKAEERATLPANIGEGLISHRNYFLGFDDEDDDDYDLLWDDDGDDDVNDDILEDDDGVGDNYYGDCDFDDDEDDEEEEEEDDDDDDEDEDENEAEDDDDDDDGDDGGDGVECFIAADDD